MKRFLTWDRDFRRLLMIVEMTAIFSSNLIGLRLILLIQICLMKFLNFVSFVGVLLIELISFVLVFSRLC